MISFQWGHHFSPHGACSAVGEILSNRPCSFISTSTTKQTWVTLKKKIAQTRSLSHTRSLTHSLTLSLSHKASVFLLYQCYIALRNRFFFFFFWSRLDVFQCALVTFADIYELIAFVFCDNRALVCFSALNMFVFLNVVMTLVTDYNTYITHVIIITLKLTIYLNNNA